MPHILDEPKVDERSNGQTINHIKMLANDIIIVCHAKINNKVHMYSQATFLGTEQNFNYRCFNIEVVPSSILPRCMIFQHENISSIDITRADLAAKSKSSKLHIKLAPTASKYWM